MHYMQAIINEYNTNHVTEVTPEIDCFVLNEMSSNYYFTYNGEKLYVDQFDLQESFDCNEYGGLCENRDDCKCYVNASIEDKAYALSELVQAQTVGL